MYNGNISETYWRTDSDNVQRKYGYKYDQLNRLKDAIYQKPGITADLTQVTNAYNESLIYDKNGNIMSLFRNGDLDPQVGTIEIDNLVYTYPDNSNQLAKVTDVSNNTSGFKDGNKTGDDYSYDANGSLTTDKNKNITEIVYNHLNLPTKITFGTTGNISFIYNSIGQKLEKIITEGTTVTKTDYLGGYLYKNAVLQYFPTAEGYFQQKEGSPLGVGAYVFQHKDHLGNVRLSYTKNPVTNVLEIIEESNYYPGGLIQKGYNNTVTSTNPGQKLLFNGKELQDELGLDWYDFGARNYMPDIVRTTTPDPLAEKFYSLSPHSFLNNNPLIFTDPDGMFATFGINADGKVTKLDDKKYYDKKGNEVDKLYAVDNKGNKKDVNNSGSVNENDSVEASAGLIGQMTNKRSGSEKNTEGGYFSSIGEQSDQHEKDYKRLFKFASDNSYQEFSLTSFKHNGKDLIQLSTMHHYRESPSPFDLGIDNPNENVSKHTHSHPGIRTLPNVENYSMGGDYQNAKADNRQYPNNVYFPNSSRLYRVTTQGTQLIKKIKSSKDF